MLKDRKRWPNIARDGIRQAELARIARKSLIQPVMAVYSLRQVEIARDSLEQSFTCYLLLFVLCQLLTYLIFYFTFYLLSYICYMLSETCFSSLKIFPLATIVRTSPNFSCVSSSIPLNFTNRQTKLHRLSSVQGFSYKGIQGFQGFRDLGIMGF